MIRLATRRRRLLSASRLGSPSRKTLRGYAPASARMLFPGFSSLQSSIAEWKTETLTAEVEVLSCYAPASASIMHPTCRLPQSVMIEPLRIVVSAVRSCLCTPGNAVRSSALRCARSTPLLTRSASCFDPSTPVAWSSVPLSPGLAPAPPPPGPRDAERRRRRALCPGLPGEFAPTESEVCWASGGPQKYTGRSMRDSHQHLKHHAQRVGRFHG